jgi:hypothetical protein
MYYDTSQFPERRHPHLVANLLAEQIEACHAKGIRVPVYTTVQWDHFTANEHPEWLILDERGCPVGTPLYEAGFWRCLCVNSPYLDFLREHVRELLETLPVDGLWLDIVQPRDCSCKYCRAKMKALGQDPSAEQDRRRFALFSINDFMKNMTRFVRQFNEDCSIFYNGGHVGPRHQAVIDFHTHFDLESLPGSKRGYMHFPATARYARTLGLDYLGMTGRFHTSWGDFHSFRNAAALEYECLRALALGAKCSIGDQLHPVGRLNEHAYRLIGAVYQEVEVREPWCREAEPVTEIGVLTPEEFYGISMQGTAVPPSVVGATRMLEEGGHQFDVLDSASDLSGYRVIILPDQVPLSERLAGAIEEYLRGGGAMIASFESGLSETQNAFATEALGVELESVGPRDSAGNLVRGRPYKSNDYAEYILPRGKIGEGLPETEHAMYTRGLHVRTLPGAQVLADGVLSYFDRSYEHFCSHRQAPSSGRRGSPAVVRYGDAIYFAHPIFTQYERNAPRWYKVLLLNALEMLLPEPLLRHTGPSTMRATINEQNADERWVVHLLHYVPERRGVDLDIVEDVIPLYKVKVSVRVPGRVKEIMCVPQQERLVHSQNGGRVEFIVPEVVGNQMVALEFG